MPARDSGPSKRVARAIVRRPSHLVPDRFAALLPSRTDAPRLRTAGLGHAFGPRVTFRRLDLDVTPGAPLAIVGPNGAGKSTLARVLAGLLDARAGTVTLTVGGADLAADDRPFSTGFVAPYLGLYDALTPSEHLAFVADGRARADLHARIAPTLAAVGLAGRAHDPVGTFSSGLRQRVRVALAVVAAPPLLVLDEPTAALDTVGAAMVDALRQAHVASGGLLVIATNDAREAAWGTQSVTVGE